MKFSIPPSPESTIILEKMRQRVYIDTSVIGGYFDDEFREVTIQLFKRWASGELIFVTSDLLDLELLHAPTQVRELLSEFPLSYLQRIEFSQEAAQLANAYIKAGVVGKTSLEDCRHIALASIHKVDVLASWNFRHIVNLDRIKGYNAVNIRFGYSILEIRSPKDLINYYEG